MPRGGVGEGLAVMLSVVVFGLGVAALVAREELRAPMPVLAHQTALTHGVAELVPGEMWSHGGGVSR